MRKNLLLFVFVVSDAVALLASTRPELAVSLIPDSLLRGANSVVRLSETTITITSPSVVRYEEHEIVTLLNESAAGVLSQSIGYDQFRKIKNFSVTIFDKDGKQMNKHGLNDMKDFSAYDGYSLFRDARFKYLQTNGGLYPVTVERNVTTEDKGYLDFHDWVIQGANQSVQSAVLTVSVPAGMDVRFKAYNTSLSPDSTKADGGKEYTWSAKGCKSLRLPSGSYHQDYYLPHVDLSPVSFEIAGYKGSMASWSAYGTALADMWRNTRNLPEDVRQEMKNMVKGAHSDREKIAILYSYLQKNFHYVSVQIGVGGWIPFDAATVHAVKYGDCKALSNYMCAALDAAGVRSHPVLINAGADLHAIDTAFPTNKFNHAILCAEADGKPLWLECTSTGLPPGELGTFTESRYGLMIGDSGGQIVATPASDPDLNTFILTTEVTRTTGDQADIAGRITLSGEYRPRAKDPLINGTEKEKATFVFNALQIKQPPTFRLHDALDSDGAVSLAISGSTENIFDFKTGSKSFLPSSFLRSWYENITVGENRNADLLLGFPYCKKEKLVYHAGTADNISLPGDFDLDNGLVYFHRQSEKTGNTATIHTELKLKKRIIHPDEVALLKESLQKVNKYLQQKVIIETK